MTRERLDRRVRAAHPELSWTRIRNAIERGQVTVEGKTERDPGRLVEESAAIHFDAARPSLKQVRLDLERLHEDDEILVIDKPAGLLTIASHPTRRESEDTVLKRAQEYARRLHGRSGYAGMLHRLDRETSGALAIALTREAHALGRTLFSEHAFKRQYLAVVQGSPAVGRGTIDRPISDSYVSGRRRIAKGTEDGRSAVTHFLVRERFEGAALVELTLETGRQHQIRLHLQSIGHPLIGERVYDKELAGGPHAPRQMLHAWRLEFPHPARRGIIKVEAPIPDDFKRLLRKLRRD